MQSAAALPFIAALSLIGGRRGNASFCLFGSAKLLQLCLFCAIAGPIWIGLSYFTQVLPYQAHLKQMLAPLFERAGAPWSLGCLIWLGGWLACVLAYAATAKKLASIAGDRYAFGAVRLQVGLSFLSAFLFFLAFACQVWPFSGLPEGLEWDRLVMAVWRHTTSAYFFCLCPAGALALASWVAWLHALTPRDVSIATRWLSFWALAGCLPGLLINWGYYLGANVNQYSLAQQGYVAQLYALSLLTLALICWGFLLWKPRYLSFLSLAAFGLLLLRSVLPFIIQRT